MAQIQALRDEGRYQEADQLFVKHVEQLADERIKPIEARANADRQVAAFQKLAVDTLTTNPKVREYHQQVIQRWDAPTPEMQAIRADILSTPERMQHYLPMVLDYFALEEHAKALEQNMEKVVESRVKAAMESNRAKARSIPPSLVNTSGVSRETKGSGGGLQGAFERALAKVAGE
jgi:predicted RecB family nuclease